VEWPCPGVGSEFKPQYQKKKKGRKTPSHKRADGVAKGRLSSNPNSAKKKEI
jgi:hypothetical protein